VRDFSSRPRRVPARPLDLALAAAGAALLAVSLYEAGEAWSAQRRAAARFEQTRREADEAQARMRELEARRGPAQGMAAQALLTTEAPPPRVLADLVALMPGDVRIDGATLSYGEPLGLQIDVAARNASSYDLFLDRLQRSPAFADVLPGEENRDGELRTSIRMSYRAAVVTIGEPVREGFTPERATK
jgi:hypothetical protein